MINRTSTARVAIIVATICAVCFPACGQSPFDEARAVIESLKNPSEDRALCQRLRDPTMEDLEKWAYVARQAAAGRRGDLGALAYEAIDRLERNWRSNPTLRTTMEALEELKIEAAVEVIKQQLAHEAIIRIRSAAQENDAAKMFSVGLRFDDWDIKCFYQCRRCALAWLIESGERGHVPAMLETGRRFHEGIGTDPNPSVAKQWFDRAVSALGERAKASDVAAMSQLGQLAFSGYGSYREGFEIPPADAVAWLRQAAAANDATGTAWLGYVYENGLADVKKDEEEAGTLYVKEVEQGSGTACVWLTRMHKKGRGGRTNNSITIGELRSRIMELGMPDAISRAYIATGAFDETLEATRPGGGMRPILVSEMYNLASSLFLLRRAEHQGARPTFTFRLGVAHNQFTNYMAAYPKKAIAAGCTLALASHGNPSSCRYIAEEGYEKGRCGVPIDDYRAAEWYARGGSAQCLLRLAEFFEQGRGGLPKSKDMALAVREEARRRTNR